MAGEKWSGRSLGSRFQHQIFYWLIRWAGPWAAYLLLYPVVFWYTLKVLAGRGFYPYLVRRFPGAGRLRRLGQSFRLNLAFGQALVDRSIQGLTGQVEARAATGTAETMDALLAEGRGLVILTAHVGAWQSGLIWLGRAKVPVNIVWLPQENFLPRLHFERDFQAAAPRQLDAVEPGLAMAAAASALLNGEIVVFMADRVRPGDTLTVRAGFLGAEINLPGGPFHLAARLGSPLAVIFSWRQGSGRQTGRFFKVIRPDPAPVAASRAASDLRPLAEAFTEALTGFVSEHPFQFFNFHDLWSD